MRNTRLWSGLSSVFSFLLVTAILGTDCMMQYEGTVNGALGIQTSKVVNGDGVDALPFGSDGAKVTLFGYAVAQPLYKAPSAGSKGYEGEYCVDLYSALTDAGFQINDTLYEAYVSSETKRGNGAYDYQKKGEKISRICAKILHGERRERML